MDYQKIMRKAHKTNSQRDKDETAFGWVAPTNCPIDLHLRTAIEAIRSGIMSNDWDCVAEGQDMLSSIHERMKGIRYGD